MANCDSDKMRDFFYAEKCTSSEQRHRDWLEKRTVIRLKISDEIYDEQKK